ncbi:MAG: hypothetical protein IJN39_01160 [Clostridia bacterium]|nr:hypothetical protein [Clostridia bacterium]
MKSQKIIPALLGVVLIVFGCIILFDSLNISPRGWLLPVAGLGILFLGIKIRNKVLRDIGVVCLILGASVIVNALFINPKYSRAFYLAAVAVSLLFVSAFRKNGWIFLLGIFLFLIAGAKFIYNINIADTLKSAYSLILIATALVFLFIVKNDRLGYKPIVVGILLYFMSLPHFLVYAGYINQNIAQIVRAVLLILAGAVLVIFVSKKVAKENES